MADTTRRGALSGLAKGLAGLLGLGALAPLAGAFLHPLRKGVQVLRKPVRVATMADFPAEGPLRAEVVDENHDAWMRTEKERVGACWLRKDGDRVRALSVVCPPLGCAVDWSPEEKRYKCPCHEARFDASGKRQSGPAPRDMDELEAKVDEGGSVWVTYRRFPVGTKNKG